MVDTKLSPQFLAEKAWDLYQTHGVPFEVSQDILEKNNLYLDQDLLDKLIEEHQNLSRTTSSGQFKSGLGQDSQKTRRLHTATHLLHKALRDLLGTEVKQKGSAITDQKARFDFTFDRRLTEEELERVASIIQEIIDQNLQVTKKEMTEKEARELGAIGLFGEKYGDIVTVYSITNNQQETFSREFCGGPHVKKTSEIGKFRFIKQKSVGAGVKRLEFDVE